MLKQPPKSTALARALRKRESWGERLMWSWLRGGRFSDYKFRRQHPILPFYLDFFYLDFFCVEAMLNVEVEGFQHGKPGQKVADEERDTFLESQGIRVLRYWSSRLRRDKETIRNAIWTTLQERAPHPLPDYCRPMQPAVSGNGKSQA
jgi:very-short-patch-repair endonuclease